jgi:UDP-N-acetylglucosamine 4,6-dehydratase
MTSYLVTGGTGSFGQAFVRRLLNDGADRIVVFSRSESKQAAMRVSLAAHDERLRFMIGDVRDEKRLMDACRGVDTVVHAAALKRVEVCEADPNEAVLTNVIGTGNVARACIERGVRRAVFLSTDKAAAPNTLYGATKLNAERLWLASNVYAGGMETRFSATRYGNVLGSTGSVVPLWRAQAESGKPLTVTDPGMTRFWMRLEDAVALVLLALREMRGGEVFIPKIGSSSIRELARTIDPRGQLAVTGPRPGEKIHETLISEEESRNAHDCGTHYVIEPECRTWDTTPPLTLPRVPRGFSYRSDTNAMRLSVDQLREMIAA